MGNVSLLGQMLKALVDHTVGDILRMFLEWRLPKQERGPLSWGFVSILLVVLAYGLVMLFSASYSSGYYYHDGDILYFIRPQSRYALFGLVLMWVVSHINYRAYRHIAHLVYLVTVALLVWALFSTPINDAHRWVYIFGEQRGFSFQPSELAKLALVLTTATYMNSHYDRRRSLVHGILAPALYLAPVLLLLYKEPHHSAMALMILIFGTMIFCGGCDWRWLPPLAAAGGYAFYMLLSTREGRAMERLGAYALTGGDTSEMLYQSKQSLYSIASGGLLGLGIGNSRQKHLWLPYAENDFIFSVVCEELGFLGAVLLIVLFVLLILLGIFIALRSPDYFGMMLGIGIVAQIAWQVFLHIGVVTGTLPNTGISLPFFSSGGTSLVLLLAEIGILLNISRAGNATIETQRRNRHEELARRIYRREGAAPQH